MKRPTHLLSKVGGALLVAHWLLAAPLAAQTYGPTTSVITAGGGISAGGAFVVSATIGQEVPGRQTGGNFTLEAGFLPTIVVVQTPGAPNLQFTRTGTNVVFYWDATVPGFALQDTAPTLPSTSWQNVTITPVLSNGFNYVTHPILPGARYFRLRKP
jgi:hypothetical protein